MFKKILFLIVFSAVLMNFSGCINETSEEEKVEVMAYRLVYGIDMSSVEDDEREEVLEGVQEVLEGRMELYERKNVYTREEYGSYVGIVEIPRADVDLDQSELWDQENYRALEFATLDEDGEWVMTELNDSYMVSAEAQIDDFFQPDVIISFNEDGAIIFEDITEQNVGKQVGIFANGVLLTAPFVNDKITGGAAVIAGDFTMEEATDLARDLNSSAMSPITLVSVNESKASF